MKKLTVAQKMRRVAGCFYFVLAVYQMYLTLYVARNGTLQNINFAMGVALLLVPAFTLMAIWMFWKKKPLSAGAPNGIIVGTAVVIIFELFTYEQQKLIINTALYETLTSLFNNDMAIYFLLVVHMLLMILAAFFTTNSRPAMDYLPGQGRADDVKLKVVDEDGKVPDASAVEIEREKPDDGKAEKAEKAEEPEADTPAGADEA